MFLNAIVFIFTQRIRLCVVVVFYFLLPTTDAWLCFELKFFVLMLGFIRQAGTIVECFTTVDCLFLQATIMQNPLLAVRASVLFCQI